MKPTSPHLASRRTTLARHAFDWRQLAVGCVLGLALMVLAMSPSHAAEAAGTHSATSAPATGTSAVKNAVEPNAAPRANNLGVDLKAALRDKLIDKKNLILVIKDRPEPKPPATAEKATSASTRTAPASARTNTPANSPAASAPAQPPAAVAISARTRTPTMVNSRANRNDLKAKAAPPSGHGTTPGSALAHDSDTANGDVQWAYEGENGPQAWGKLKPEFNVCATGKRQSPINIDESTTLQGPAEPLQFNYAASGGTVVNNGRTIQVDMLADNTLTVRGSVYKLVQFHFHTPSGEQVNNRSFAMVAHLVHKNNEGQLAIVAVLIDAGEANALIDKVWTYMPLDSGDRVRMPAALIDMNALLPKDRHYYQYLGSRTMPPCTEGVLWMVLKQPTQLSPAQIRLFQQLFPHNARPVQPVNGRPVRDAQ